MAVTSFSRTSPLGSRAPAMYWLTIFSEIPLRSATSASERFRALRKAFNVTLDSGGLIPIRSPLVSPSLSISYRNSPSRGHEKRRFRDSAVAPRRSAGVA
jgi:hypothetical protein